jgi:hypothetical protein
MPHPAANQLPAMRTALEALRSGQEDIASPVPYLARPGRCSSMPCRRAIAK